MCCSTAGARVTVLDDLSTGALGEPRRRAQPRRAAGRRERDRRRARSTACADARPTPCSTSPRRSTCAAPSPTRRATRTVNLLGTVTVLDAARRPASARRAAPRPAARSTATPTSCRRPRRHAARPLSPVRRVPRPRETYLRLYRRAARALDVHAAARQRLRPAPGSGGEAGVIAIFCTRARRRAGHDLRRRRPDPRLRLRRRRRRARSCGGRPRGASAR